MVGAVKCWELSSAEAVTLEREEILQSSPALGKARSAWVPSRNKPSQLYNVISPSSSLVLLRALLDTSVAWTCQGWGISLMDLALDTKTSNKKTPLKQHWDQRPRSTLQTSTIVSAGVQAWIETQYPDKAVRLQSTTWGKSVPNITVTQGHLSVAKKSVKIKNLLNTIIL